jgi:hypothetical protein
MTGRIDLTRSGNGRFLRIAVVMHFGERVSVSRPVA